MEPLKQKTRLVLSSQRYQSSDDIKGESVFYKNENTPLYIYLYPVQSIPISAKVSCDGEVFPLIAEEPILTSNGLLILKSNLIKSIGEESLNKELELEFRIKWKKQEGQRSIYAGINEFIHQASQNKEDVEIFTKKITIMQLITIERVSHQDVKDNHVIQIILKPNLEGLNLSNASFCLFGTSIFSDNTPNRVLFPPLQETQHFLDTQLDQYYDTKVFAPPQQLSMASLYSMAISIQKTQPLPYKNLMCTRFAKEEKLGILNSHIVYQLQTPIVFDIQVNDQIYQVKHDVKWKLRENDAYSFEQIKCSRVGKNIKMGFQLIPNCIEIDLKQLVTPEKLIMPDQILADDGITRAICLSKVVRLEPIGQNISQYQGELELQLLGPYTSPLTFTLSDYTLGTVTHTLPSVPIHLTIL
ncbi:hypothetical protein FGO68_gene9488 [Halteria grandinella]|uniref:Uncharacterized protein n=1 Tax=Halteria grandinella TaxID=5974 RepID=A0A8J8SVY6_HALGN|nr:hypothetical protein FGO68_gene9488 [Halteria grandinella]